MEKLKEILRKKSLFSYIYSWLRAKHWWHKNKSKFSKFYPKSPTSKNHVILLVIDALRRSNLSVYGYERKTTPFLEDYSETGVVFDFAVAASPWTYPSVASILTGLYPHKHGAGLFKKLREWLDSDLFNLYQDVRTLPEILSMQGYTTFLLSSIAYVVPYASRFDYSFYKFKVPASVLLQLAFDILKSLSNSAAFVYVHLGDLHVPIRLLKKYTKILGKIKKIDSLEYWDFGNAEDLDSSEFLEYKENRILLYDSALRYVDDQLEKFFDRLKKYGLLDGSTIVLTADHGEGFWEHAKEEKEFFRHLKFYGISHGHSVFQEYLWVPLIVWDEKIEPGFRKFPVSHVDILNTLLDLLDIESENYLTDDVSVLKKQPVNRPILSEEVCSGFEKKSIILYPFKLIYSPDDQVELYFDLAQDPNEKHPLDNSQIDLKKYLPSFEIRRSNKEKISNNKTLEEHLKGLGYI